MLPPPDEFAAIDPGFARPLHRRRRTRWSAGAWLALCAVTMLGWSSATAIAARTTPAKNPAAGAAATRPSAAPGDYGKRADVDAFIDSLVSGDGFLRSDLVALFGQVQRQTRVIDAMSRPLVQPPKWFEYSPQFLSEERIDGGVQFWKANQSLLVRVEAEYGIPAEVIVAIIGVETFYGRNTGGYRVIDALSTLAFDYPRRSEFFTRELRQFLLLSRELGVSPLAPRGSFAGAMGIAQFMPGSYRAYGVDYDRDQRVDLWRSPADVVGSIANYLARHDWAPGKPVLEPMTIRPESVDLVVRKLDGGISERRPLEAWRRDGVEGEPSLEATGDDLVGVVLLERAEGPSYWLAFNNFYVITRYNRSRLYAAAVWELARAIRARRVAEASVPTSSQTPRAVLSSAPSPSFAPGR